MQFSISKFPEKYIGISWFHINIFAYIFLLTTLSELIFVGINF